MLSGTVMPSLTALKAAETLSAPELALCLGRPASVKEVAVEFKAYKACLVVRFGFSAHKRARALEAKGAAWEVPLSLA